ncbi:MAG: TetR/AcrR family transcriptional regulator [Candidatus Nanopelagicales bacterium]
MSRAAVRPRMSAADRRQQLVEVGLDLLEVRPIHELALDEVAAAAGVSRTLVFHYFPSKGDFYAAVVASAGEGLLAFEPDLAEPDPHVRLRAMITAFLKLVSRKRAAYVALVRGASGGDPKVLALLDDLRASLVERWLQAAAWPARDPLTLLAVRGWLGSLEEVALAAADSPVERAAAVELLVGGFWDALERSGE